MENNKFLLNKRTIIDMSLSIYEDMETTETDIQYHVLDRDKFLRLTYTNCNLCKNELKIKDHIIVSLCEHIFHMNCMMNWLSMVF